MLKITKLPNVLAFRKNDGNNEVVGFGVDKNANKLNKKSKWKLSKSKNPCLTSATEEHNFLTFDAKTNFRFWSDFI